MTDSVRSAAELAAIRARAEFFSDRKNYWADEQSGGCQRDLMALAADVLGLFDAVESWRQEVEDAEARADAAEKERDSAIMAMQAVAAQAERNAKERDEWHNLAVNDDDWRGVGLRMEAAEARCEQLEQALVGLKFTWDCWCADPDAPAEGHEIACKATRDALEGSRE